MGKFSYARLPELFRTSINFSGSGDNVVVPADPFNRIVIHRIWLVCAGATNLIFKDNLQNPAPIAMGQNGGLTFDATGEPWFITNPATAFIINSGTAVQVGGEVYYTLSL